jgi:dihydrodipicolinate synthase/N-acetylneuraminate lyase
VKALLRARGFGDYATRWPLMDLTPQREAELLQRFPEIAG